MLAGNKHHQIKYQEIRFNVSRITEKLLKITLSAGFNCTTEMLQNQKLSKLLRV